MAGLALATPLLASAQPAQEAPPPPAAPPETLPAPAAPPPAGEFPPIPPAAPPVAEPPTGTEPPPGATPGAPPVAPAADATTAPSAAVPTLASTMDPTAPSADYGSSSKGFSHGLQFVYFNVETGYQKVGLRTLHTSNLLPETADTSGEGAFFGVGGGVELVFLTIGPRFRTASLDSWNFWTLDLEAKIHLPLGRVEPYFIFAGGYAKMDVNDTGTADVGPVSIRGFNARLGLGFDVFATKNITIGASATAELLAMSRSGQNLTSTPQSQAATCSAIVDPVQKQQCAADAVYAADGSSLGVAGTFALVAGLHF